MTRKALLFQINRSEGGVPKLPVNHAEVMVDGLVGDQQKNRVHHGGPERALCLYSLEKILELQAEGHPIVPGSTGENLTLTGLDWPALVPGCRLALGEQVEIEITSFTTPCKAIAGSFVDAAIARILHERNPGWSRLYARVLRPGRLMVGDAVRFVG